MLAEMLHGLVLFFRNQEDRKVNNTGHDPEPPKSISRKPVSPKCILISSSSIVAVNRVALDLDNRKIRGSNVGPKNTHPEDFLWFSTTTPEQIPIW